jgi:hypothetical protein
MMKVVRWTMAVAALALVLPLLPQDRALGAQGDPELIIYRFPGALDDGGGPSAGVATSVHCTNFSGATETIRYVVRNSNTEVLANLALPMIHLRTLTVSTHITNLYFDDRSMETGAMHQGTIAIAATSINIICTAVTLDAASTKPVGIALRGIRFNPVPGSQE